MGTFQPVPVTHAPRPVPDVFRYLHFTRIEGYEVPMPTVCVRCGSYLPFRTNYGITKHGPVCVGCLTDQPPVVPVH